MLKRDQTNRCCGNGVHCMYTIQYKQMELKTHSYGETFTPQQTERAQKEANELCSYCNQVEDMESSMIYK